MPLFGSHLSIAGGYHKAARAATELGMDTVQLFTKNNNQWRAKALTDEDARLFKAAIKDGGLKIPCAHDSYLINVASPDDALWRKSLDALVVEMERAEALGLAGVVMHPGSYVESSEAAGLKRIIKALNEAVKRTKGFAVEFWLENTAGQGTNLGHRFEHLATLIDGVKDSTRLGVCIDTCHTFAAGYGLRTKSEYKATIDELDKVVGLDRVRAFHLNDSKKPQGSRVDRHEHIGEGELGLDPFRFLLNDKRFAKLPMYLETKKEDRGGEPMDAVNLRTLRSLVSR
ncbi:MAG: deoxyribonuclease IV [Planctomycetaceae bacterium]